MIENKIYFIDSPADVNPLLAADIGKSFSKFQKELAQSCDQCIFQIAFFIDWKLWQIGACVKIDFVIFTRSNHLVKCFLQ